MSEKMYVVISAGEDPHVEAMDRDTLLGRLNENYWGSDRKPTMLKPGESVDLNAVEGLYIIQGKTILPKAVTTVKEWGV